MTNLEDMIKSTARVQEIYAKLHLAKEQERELLIKREEAVQEAAVTAFIQFTNEKESCRMQVMERYRAQNPSQHLPKATKGNEKGAEKIAVTDEIDWIRDPTGTL
jgi:hypothetical protein